MANVPSFIPIVSLINVSSKAGAATFGKLKKLKILKAKSKKFKALKPPKGTGHNYHVFQNNQIDWKFKYKGETNLDRALRGRAPIVKDGNKYRRVELHHFKQNAKGPLMELTTKQHDMPGLHPHGRNKHPTNPVDRKLFAKDRKAYWQWRASLV